MSQNMFHLSLENSAFKLIKLINLFPFFSITDYMVLLSSEGSANQIRFAEYNIKYVSPVLELRKPSCLLLRIFSTLDIR